MPRHEDTLIRPQKCNEGVDGRQVLGVSEKDPEKSGEGSREEEREILEDSETRKPQVAKRRHTPH